MYKTFKSIAVVMSAILLLFTGCAKDEPAAPVEISEEIVFEDPPVAPVEETEHVHEEEEIVVVENETVAEPAVLTLDSLPEIVDGDIELSQDDIDLVSVLEPDIIVVDDASFPETVSEMMYHVGEFTGQLYQLEGVYSTQLDEYGTGYLYRVLDNGGEQTIAALPITMYSGEITENSWIRVTAIIGVGEVNGFESTVLEVVALENTDPGTATLIWTGSSHVHSH